MTPATARPTLYTLRLDAGFSSQAKIAAQLGLSTGHYALIETGRCATTPAMAAKLARVLDVPVTVVWELLWGDEADESPARMPTT